jgi:hypothetical protein
MGPTQILDLKVKKKGPKEEKDVVGNKRFKP